MPYPDRLKFLFVLNPISGGIHKANWEENIRNYFKTSAHEYELYVTRGEHDKESIRHWIDEWQPDRVVAVGGDGTLKLVAEVLIGTGIPIGIMPAGSANGMATELGLPNSTDECIEILFKDELRKVDIIRINGSDICLHLSDIGMNAHLVKYFEEKGLRGKLGYARGILMVLWKRKLLSVRINTGDEMIEREAYMVVLANARMYGTGAMINPDGILDDGIFEVIIIRELSIIELLKMFFHRRNFNQKKVEIHRARSVDIQVEKRAYFQVDGEYRGKTLSIKATIERQVLNLLAPSSNSA